MNWEGLLILISCVTSTSNSTTSFIMLWITLVRDFQVCQYRTCVVEMRKEYELLRRWGET